MSETPGTPVTRPLRIIFMGTPDFAAACLEALLASEDLVVAIVAQPDKPAGRGNKLRSPPTVELARQSQIPVLQPSKVRGNDFPSVLRAFAPDLIVVVAYGRILTQTVLDVPPLGCINVHASLLPKFRGAGPIQWSILKGESVTGITTMQMDAGMDTGAMLLRCEVPILPAMTADELHDQLKVAGSRLLVQTLQRLKAGTLAPKPQNHHDATYAPLLKKEDGLIDWQRPAREIDCHVRGMTSWPGAFTYFEGSRLIVVRGSFDDLEHTKEPGTVISTNKDAISVATGAGIYRIFQVKPENSKQMDSAAFINGHKLHDGQLFSHA